MKKVAQLLAMIVVASAFLFGPIANAQKTKFEANLSGKNEIPPIDTSAQGQATFEVSPDGKSLKFALNVNNPADVTMAHIHLGEPGQAGKPVAPLYPAKMSSMSSMSSEKGAGSSGDKMAMGGMTCIAQGTITSASLVGPLKGKTLQDLLDDIRAGKAYVNVHTKAHSDGEIRGPIE
jgi:CHRD domain